MSNLATIPLNAPTQPITPYGERVQNTFELLDVYAPGGIVESSSRMDAIATISAGKKDGNMPKRSTDGTIFLHDDENRAPGLLAALELNNRKSLTIAFPFDDLGLIIQQRFTEYSASNLLAYGDKNGITQLTKKNGQPHRVFHLPSSPQFEEIKARCKVSASIYFHLARWNEDGQSEVFFPDGLGFYRLRFTSRNSLRSIVASLQTTSKYMGGRIAGIPFELSIDNREVAGPDGSKRRVPIWRCLFKTPREIALSSLNFREISDRALEQGKALMLAPPPPETLELAALEGPEIDLDSPTDAEIAQLQNGGGCDEAHYKARFFAEVKGTALDSKEARAKWIGDFCVDKELEPTHSLAELLARITDEQAQDFIAATQDEINWKLDEAKNSYGRLLDEAEELGIKRRELSADVDWPTVQTFTASLGAAIERRKVKPTQTPKPAAPRKHAYGPDFDDDEALNGQGAANISDDITEGEVVETSDAEIAAAVAGEQDDLDRADDLLEGEEPTQDAIFLMSKFADKGVQHGGDMSFAPMITAINAYRDKRKTPPQHITTVAHLTSAEVAPITTALFKGQLVVE